MIDMAQDITALVFYLALFILASFVAGRIYNSIKINRLSTMFRDALAGLNIDGKLKVLGPKAIAFSGESFGSSIGRFSIGIFIMGRENILNWALARLAGRDDIAVFRARIRGVINTEIDAVREGTPPARKVKRIRNKLVVNEHIFITRRNVSVSEHAYRRVSEYLRSIEGLWSFSLRKTVPELVVTFSINGLNPEKIKKNLVVIDKIVDMSTTKV